MRKEDIKELLDESYDKYCDSSFFIDTDPIQIPKLFEAKEDIEIAGFLAATFAWGQRSMIIKKSKEFLHLLDNTPYDFIMNASERDVAHIRAFKHRTFNGEDALFFIKSLKEIYNSHSGLETVFNKGYLAQNSILDALRYWNQIFSAHNPTNSHAQRHIANVDKGSAAKRINMFLRWMVRKDDRNIDFGIWKNIPASDLLIPLDLHSGNTARELGLLTIKQNNLKAVLELTSALKEFDCNDPIKYDFALFGIGAFSK